METVRALGIMTGDENGEMRLEENVTRAQFAKLLTAASAFRDEVTPDGAGWSLYKDVKSGHWASGYIRVAAREGWMIGYTDGTFRPENPITLEECCASALRLLGYDSASLAGSFPWAQLDKAAALGLRKDLARQQGEIMTRGDCARLFYNLLSAKNASGQRHAAALGYSLTASGEVDYTAFLYENLRGPFVAAAEEALPFTPLTVYRDGKPSGSAALAENEVYYYNTGLATLWVYTGRVSGKVEAVAPESGTPTAVTVDGKSYRVDSSAAAYRLSALSGTAKGSYVTLLLGMNGAVAGVLTGEAVNGLYRGVVQSCVQSAAPDGGLRTAVGVFCMDGVVRTFTLRGAANFRTGRAVLATVTEGGENLELIASPGIVDRFDDAMTRLGGRKLASDLLILDTDGMGGAVTVEPERLAGVYLAEGDVLYYSLNAAGALDSLILNDVTGDTWTYAFLTEVRDLSTEHALNVTYTYLTDGAVKSFHSTSALYPVEARRGIAIRYDAAGAVERMLPLAALELDGIGNRTAVSGNRSYPVSDRVQVYLLENGAYFQTALSALDPAGYRLTGWLTAGGKTGDTVRMVTAVPRSILQA